jgi:hypothetical protein
MMANESRGEKGEAPEGAIFKIGKIALTGIVDMMDE